MSTTTTLRRFLGATLICGTLALLPGAVAHADGGEATGAPPAKRWVYPGLTKYPEVKLERAAEAAEPPHEVITFVFHQIQSHGSPTLTKAWPYKYN